MDIAVVGAGYWGSKHVKVLKKLRDEGKITNLVVIESDSKIRANLCEIDRIESNINASNCHAAVIATPSANHAEHAISLLTNGHHLLVEKPLACNEQEAAAILSCAREHGRILSVGFLLRFHPAVSKAVSMLKRGEIGRFLSFKYLRKKIKPPLKNAEALEELGVHGLDLVCYLLGESEPKTMIVTGTQREASICFGFADGSNAFVDVGWGSKKEEKRIEIIGEKASISIDLEEYRFLRVESKFESKTIKCENPKPPLELEIIQFIESVNAHLSGSKWNSTPDHGASLRSVRWIEKALCQLSLAQPH